MPEKVKLSSLNLVRCMYPHSFTTGRNISPKFKFCAFFSGKALIFDHKAADMVVDQLFIIVSPHQHKNIVLRRRLDYNEKNR
jgi:hypothetical protein